MDAPQLPGPASPPGHGGDPRARILTHALEAGFDLAGIAPMAPPPDAARFARWVDDGRHGSMAYLERGRAATEDPRSAWPRGRSLLMLGMGHSREPVTLPGGARVARYAAGRDYHNVVQKRLRRLRRQLVADGLASPGPGFVDATPLLERSHAATAGLGFPSKAANLLHPRFGPWFFLAELVLEDELEPTPQQTPHGSCGSCTACIDACPTGAILEPGLVDGRRCISYATIEHRGLVDHELREGVGPWAFGCDVCSEVCPWGRRAPDLAARFGLRPEFADGPAQDGEALVAMLAWATAPEDGRGEAFAAAYQGSPLRRPGPDGLARNAAIALGSTPAERGRDALLDALGRAHAPMVRAAIAWALVHGHGEDRGVRPAVESALGREPDTSAAADIATTLERSGR